MNVQHSLPLGNGHSIEIGQSTWNPQGERSIRDRWTKPGGGFSNTQSSELPIASLVALVSFAAQHDELSAAEASEIIAALAASIKRQHP